MKIKKFAKTALATLIAAAIGVGAFAMMANPAQAAVGPVKNNKSALLTQENAVLEIFAESQYQWAGLAIDKGDRIFVSFPAWGAAPPDFQIAEIKDGAPVPLFKGQPFTSVRRIYCDKLGRLWALDEGDAAKQIAPKLCRLDLASQTIAKEYSLASAIKPKSRLSDVRVDHSSNTAYFADCGDGAIIVLDLNSGDAYRAIEDDEVVRKNLNLVIFRNTGVYNEIGDVSAIELSDDNKTLYFQAMGGDIIHSIPTNVLRNPKLTSQQRSKKAVIETFFSAPTSGMVLRDSSILLMGDLPDEGIWAFDFLDETHKGGLFDVGIDVKWADSFAIDGREDLYFTETQRNFPLDKRETYRLFRVKWREGSKSKNVTGHHDD